MSKPAKLLVLPKPKRSEPSEHRGKRGAGCIWQPTYKTADGKIRKCRTYWLKYTAAGQRFNENSHCTTSEGAQAKLNIRLGKIATGEFDFKLYQDVTLSQILAEYRAAFVSTGNRSVKKLDRSIRRLQEFFGADRPVVSIDVAAVDLFRNRRIEQGAEFPLINRELACLKAAFRLGVKRDTVRRSPDIVLQSETEREREGEFTAEHYARLLAELPLELRQLARFAYGTGSRMGVPLSLTWAEVDLVNGFIRVPARRMKSKRRHTIPLVGDVLAVIQEQKALHDTKFPACAFVFHTARGNQITDPYTEWDAACKRIGIQFPEFDGTLRWPIWHDFRRTFARRADRAGLSITEIMDAAGWQSPAMVIRYLGTTNEARLKERALKLAGCL